MTDDIFDNMEEQTASSNTLKFAKTGDYFVGFIKEIRDNPNMPGEYEATGNFIVDLQAIAPPKGKSLKDNKKKEANDGTVTFEDNPIEIGETYTFFCNYDKNRKLHRNGIVFKKNNIPLGAIVQFNLAGFIENKNPAFKPAKDLRITAAKKPSGKYIIHKDYVEIGSADEAFADTDIGDAFDAPVK